jgi:hypothetical protein
MQQYLGLKMKWGMWTTFQNFLILLEYSSVIFTAISCSQRIILHVLLLQCDGFDNEEHFIASGLNI